MTDFLEALPLGQLGLLAVALVVAGAIGASANRLTTRQGTGRTWAQIAALAVLGCIWFLLLTEFKGCSMVPPGLDGA